MLSRRFDALTHALISIGPNAVPKIANRFEFTIEVVSKMKDEEFGLLWINPIDLKI
jgi:hypothetical protein